MNSEMAYNTGIQQNTSTESITSQGLKLLSSKREQQDFGNYLEKAQSSKKSENVEIGKNEIKAKQKYSSKQAANKNDTNVKASSLNDRTQKPEDSIKNDISDNNVKKSNKTEDGATVTDKADDKKISDKIIDDVAEVLGVTKEKVMEILNTLNISVFDLSDHTVLTDFLQELYSVSDISELLNVPNIKDMLIGIEGVINNQISNPDNLMLGEDAVTDGIPDAMAVKTGVEANSEAEQLQGKAHVSEESESVVAVSGEVQAEVSVGTEAVEENDTGIALDIKDVSENGTTVQAGAYSEKSESIQENEALPVLAEENSSKQATAIITEANIQPEIKYNSSGNLGAQLQNGNSKEGSNTGFDNNFNQDDIQNPSSISFATSPAMLFRETQLRSMSTSNINTQDVVNQIVEKMKIEIKANVSEIKLLLKPESLGEVTLKVSIENGIVTAQFVAENQRVKEIIESNFSQLKDTLQQQGVNIAELNVTVGQDKAQERMDVYNRSRQKNARRIQQIIGKVAAEEELAENGSNALDIEERVVDLMA